jgi:hypothetical protein
MRTVSFERFAGLAAILAGLSGFLYSVSFVVLKDALLSGLFLMLGGLFTIAALVALFDRLGDTDSAFALLGMIVGTVSSLGSAIHGSYDLANALRPPSGVPAGVDALPSPIDPRGFLTFGAAGLALLVAAYLIGHSHYFPRSFALATYLLSILLVIIYLDRLIVYNPASPLILVPAALTGFIVNPLWYVWLGLALRRERAQEATSSRVRA